MGAPEFQISISPAAWEDLDRLPVADATRVLRKIRRLAHGLTGDVKRLQNADYGFRLRMGNYRALFDVENGQILVRKVGHRKDVYE
jgi:mRNA interferase RelE/StbE